MTLVKPIFIQISAWNRAVERCYEALALLSTNESKEQM